MRAPHVPRPRFDTLDYGDDEAATDLIMLLTRGLTRAPKESTSRLRAVAEAAPTTRRPAPMIVDKNQLVAIARVLRPVPKTTPTRIPRLSWLVLEERACRERRARRRTWLARIAFVAILEVLVFAATAPAAQVLLHDCITQSWCGQ